MKFARRFAGGPDAYRASLEQVVRPQSPLYRAMPHLSESRVIPV